MEVVQRPAPGDASSDEEDEEGQEEGVEDSQILEDLPDETEVRGLWGPVARSSVQVVKSVVARTST